MKNCYFGDIYDYIKYALLRQLTDSGRTSSAVCWMLTEDDGGSDGRRTNYLREPEKWASPDPELFDFLRRQVLEREIRNVRAIERSDLLPNCHFYSRTLTDDRVQRQRYFDKFMEFAHQAQLVFFDPDNGIEVKSVGYGRRKSSKYLYWNEIELAFHANHSLLIYQHLPPKPRRPYIRHITRRLIQMCRGNPVHVIRTGRVAFLLVPQRDNIPELRKTVRALEKRWGGILLVSTHRRI